MEQLDCQQRRHRNEQGFISFYFMSSHLTIHRQVTPMSCQSKAGGNQGVLMRYCQWLEWRLSCQQRLALAVA